VTGMATTKMRLGRLVDERDRTAEKIEDALGIAEEEERDLTEPEQSHLEKYRSKVVDLDGEIALLASDLERANEARDVSALLRDDPKKDEEQADGPIVYRTFAAYARDALIVRYPMIASAAVRDPSRQSDFVEQAQERLHRAIQHTLTSDVAGLLPPTHLAQIMDIIDSSRPVVSSARRVNLASGRLTYPKIDNRPTVSKQATEKTEAGTAGMDVSMQDLTADTYLGGGNLSWQTINWSTPDALQLWFDLAAESYARATETAACTDLGTAAVGTISPALGTAGTEDFAAWRAAAFRAMDAIYQRTGGRTRTNTLYLSASRFFSLAGLGSPNDVQVSPVGNVNVEAMTGTWSGLRVVGSYGLTGSKAIVGDSSAFLVAETAGAPVEMRAVEPAIGGMEVGVIGAFKSKVFDGQRFINLS
jgi:HK97 family phage major capsid protein